MEIKTTIIKLEYIQNNTIMPNHARLLIRDLIKELKGEQ